MAAMAPALSVLLADDDTEARAALRLLLGGLRGVTVTGEAADGPGAVSENRRLRPDLVCLDLRLPGLDGLGVARQLADDGCPPAIVFVSGYDEGAGAVFSTTAVDYLLKPVTPDRLARALTRARQALVRRDAATAGAADGSADAAATGLRTHVAVRVADRLLLVPTAEIIHASVVDESITIVTGQLFGASSFRTLDDLQAVLDPDVFWRVHRAHLVNIRKVREIVPWFSRNYLLRMRDPNATEIPVSRTQTRRLRSYLHL